LVQSSRDTCSRLLVKLDRVLCSVDWELLFPMFYFKVLLPRILTIAPCFWGLGIINLENEDFTSNPFGPSWMVFRKLFILDGML
jgi:hypothetical protein